MRRNIEAIGTLCALHGSWTSPTLLYSVPEASHHFVMYLRHLLPIISHPQPQAQDDILISRVKTNIDFYLPFRECAPTQMHVTQPGHLFNNHDNFAATRGGLFSALVLRGITYGTPTSRQHSGQFTTDTAWFTHVWDNSHRGPTFLANLSIYGAPNFRREPNAATSYWKGSIGWNDYLRDHVRCFTDAFNYISRFEHG